MTTDLERVNGCREFLGPRHWCNAARADESDYCKKHLAERLDWRIRMWGHT